MNYDIESYARADKGQCIPAIYRCDAVRRGTTRPIGLDQRLPTASGLATVFKLADSGIKSALIYVNCENKHDLS